MYQQAQVNFREGRFGTSCPPARREASNRELRSLVTAHRATPNLEQRIRHRSHRSRRRFMMPGSLRQKARSAFNLALSPQLPAMIE
jgi:hypothetical protein